MGFVVPFLAIVLVSTLALVFLRPKRQKLPYPPGPPPIPLLGNALDLPSEKPWAAYRNLSKKYNSDMIHLTAMNQHILVLNKVKDGVNLLEKRSSIYSSRPTVPIVDMYDRLGVGHVTPLLPYGDEWRKHRKFYQEGLRKELVPSYNEIHLEKVHLLLGQLLRSPEKLTEHSKWLAAAVTMSLTFGYEYPPGKEHDHFVELAEETISGVSSLVLPGSTIINVLSFLKYIPPWVPGATTQKFAARIRRAAHMYRNEPFQFVERRMAAGLSRQSILGRVLQHREKNDEMYEDEELLKDAVMTTYLAGVETLQSSMMVFFMTMALYPNAQKRAQEEIDSVIGTDRLPNFEDRDSLRYTEALLREVFRWWCVVPQGMPHTLTTDDVYNGFYIPKGTMVIPNAWAMMRDEEMYPDPDSFRPERFFHDDGTLNDDTVPYAFGFGRRACPGRHLSESVLWLLVACVLSTFKIAKARDEKGVEIEIDRDGYINSVISTPLPFDCSITPRSSRAASLIHDTILTMQLNH